MPTCPGEAEEKKEEQRIRVDKGEVQQLRSSLHESWCKEKKGVRKKQTANQIVSVIALFISAYQNFARFLSPLPIKHGRKSNFYISKSLSAFRMRRHEIWILRKTFLQLLTNISDIFSHTMITTDRNQLTTTLNRNKVKKMDE